MATLTRLVETSLSGQSLSGSFVPENNNEGYTDAAGLTTVTIVDNDEEVVAFGAAARYTKTSVSQSSVKN